MIENWAMICVGFLLVMASFFARGVGNKAMRSSQFCPPSVTIRVILFSLGIFAAALGVFHLAHK
jgi:hypothetical protein